MTKPNTLNITVVLILVLLCSGCTKLVFENPIPIAGEMVQVLPDYFKGTFLKKGENTYYYIERLNDQHCMVYSAESIHKDSINTFINHLKNDSTDVEFQDSQLIIREKDTSQIINLKLENDRYFGEKERLYEINLKNGYFIDDFEKLHQKQALLKSYDNHYFLNIRDTQDHWFAVWLKKKGDTLIIHNSFIADTAFTDNLSHYNKLTAFNKIADKTYLASPTDQELFTILGESVLFNQEIWIRVDDNRHDNWIWLLFGFVIIFLFLMAMVIFRRKHNTRHKA